jgi:Ser/Thr protein kinase RdoA (MazF antagonist)
MVRRPYGGVTVNSARVADRLRHVDQIAAIETALGVRLDSWAAAGGQRRTFLARYAGASVVVKWGLDRDLPEKIPYVAGLTHELRRRQIPVPAIMAHGHISTGGYAWMLPRLPGSPARVLSSSLLDQLVDLLDRFADAPTGPHRSDIGWWVSAVIHDDVAGYWAATAALGPRAVALCGRLRTWVAEVPPPPPRHDFVHIDLNLGNVLVDGDQISGIIDIENFGVGDRTVDTARLAFEWFQQDRRRVPGRACEGLTRLAAYGRDCSGESGWRYAVTHEILSRLGWRSEHVQVVDPATLVDASAQFLDHAA